MQCMFICALSDKYLSIALLENKLEIILERSYDAIVIKLFISVFLQIFLKFLFVFIPIVLGREVEIGSFQSSTCKFIRMKNTVIDGRHVTFKELTHKLKDSTKIYQVDNFLTKEECDALSVAHLKYVKKSNDVGPLFCFYGLTNFQKYLVEAGYKHKVSLSDFVKGTSCINETFSDLLKRNFEWSFSTAFYSGESKFSLIYEKRLEQISGLTASHGGKFQITSYPESIGESR